MLLLPCAVSAMGNISVSSVPTGVTILLNGTNTGSVTPVTLENIPTGSHTILLQKSGYLDYSQTVTVTDDATSTVSQTLTAVVAAPTISSISPSSGYNSSTISITSIAGTGFSTSSAPEVVLMKSGQTNITATAVTSSSTTSIGCTFNIINKQAGYWNVIVTNPDGQSATLTNGFEIKDSSVAVTLSSITPSSAQTNTTVSITSLSGTGFVVTPQIILRRSLYNDLYGSVTSATTTNIVGTFDLTNRDPGNYQICVINSGAEPVCGLTFTINTMVSTAVNGSINVKSSPSISKVFLNTVYQGYTPMTLDNITPGTYTVLIRHADYNDYSESVTVTAGNISYVTASLVLAPEETTATVTAPKTAATTVKTTTKATAKVPTPWPSATPAPASPVGVLVILGAVGIGFIVLRKL